MTTPSDLKGSAVGEAAERTRAIIESAKGKVLFIDEGITIPITIIIMITIIIIPSLQFRSKTPCWWIRS